MRELRIAYTGPHLAGCRSSLEHVQRRLRHATAVRWHTDEHGHWVEFSVASSAVRLTVVAPTGSGYDFERRERLCAIAHAVVLVIDSQAERADANEHSCEWLAASVVERPVVVQLKSAISRTPRPSNSS